MFWFGLDIGIFLVLNVLYVFLLFDLRDDRRIIKEEYRRLEEKQGGCND